MRACLIINYERCCDDAHCARTRLAHRPDGERLAPRGPGAVRYARDGRAADRRRRPRGDVRGRVGTRRGGGGGRRRARRVVGRRGRVSPPPGQRRLPRGVRRPVGEGRWHDALRPDRRGGGRARRGVRRDDGRGRRRRRWRRRAARRGGFFWVRFRVRRLLRARRAFVSERRGTFARRRGPVRASFARRRSRGAELPRSVPRTRPRGHQDPRAVGVCRSRWRRRRRPAPHPLRPLPRPLFSGRVLRSFLGARVALLVAQGGALGHLEEGYAIRELERGDWVGAY